MKKIAPKNNTHNALARIALSAYLGEKCKFCGKKYNTLEDLEDTVWAGIHENGRLACKKCWEKQQS